MNPPYPGLAKVRAIPLVGVRRVELVSISLPRILELLAAADVVSEGREIVGVGGRRVYFGSTSVSLRPPADERARPAVIAGLAGDLHLRALVLRRAREEAAARASGPVGTARAELSMRAAGGDLQIVVDLEIAVARAARAGR